MGGHVLHFFKLSPSCWHRELKNDGVGEGACGSRALQHGSRAAKEGTLLKLKIENVKKDFFKFSNKN
jgi:hypothetical protein